MSPPSLSARNLPTPSPYFLVFFLHNCPTKVKFYPQVGSEEPVLRPATLRTLCSTAVAEGRVLGTANKRFRGSSQSPPLTAADESGVLSSRYCGGRDGDQAMRGGGIFYTADPGHNLALIFQKHAFCPVG
jgi:hypothetical protein